MTVAHDIARQIAIDVGSRSARHVVVVDDDGIELFKTPVEL
jgi:ribulose kinase